MMKLVLKKTLEKIGNNEKKCINLEFNNKESSSRFKSFKRIFCLMDNNNFNLKSLNSIINKGFENSYSTIQYNNIDITKLVEKFFVNYISRDKSSNFEASIFNSKGMENSNTKEIFLNYDQILDCRICYSVQNNSFSNDKINKDCCIEYTNSKKNVKEYLCNGDQFR